MISYPYLSTLLIISFVSSLLFIRLAKVISHKKNLMDVPNHRSSHSTPTPRIGGLAFGLIILAMWLCIQTHLNLWNCSLLTLLFSGAMIVFIVGALDDFYPISAWIRLSIQTILAFLIAASLDQALHFETSLFTRVALFYVLLPFWIVGLINAFNFMDGIDGLAGGHSLVASLAWVCVGALLQEYIPLTTYIAGSIVACTAAFLIFNWSPASIFMGDGGSTLLGYIFAIFPCITIFLQTETSPTEMVVHFALSSFIVLPFWIDALITCISRALKKESLLQGKRDYTFHFFVRSNLKHPTVVLLYLIISALSSGIGVLFILNTSHTPIVVLTVGLEVTLCLLIIHLRIIGSALISQIEEPQVSIAKEATITHQAEKIPQKKAPTPMLSIK